MNTPIRRVSVGVIAMFLSLFVAATIIQVFQFDELKRNPYNTRTLLASYDVERGPILVNGTPIAQSTPVDTEYKYERVYTQGELYSAVTGYYTHTQGSTGLEEAMDAELSGQSDAQFFQGLTGLFTGSKPAGAAVEVTIDPIAQQAAWDALGDMKGAVVAIDPKTGAILAMVSKPTFDPNSLVVHDSDQMLATYNQLLTDPDNPLYNRAIGGDLNPPGSVFKLVVAAAALENGLATADSPLPNPATYTLPGSTSIVNNPSHGSPCGSGETTTLRIAIEQSCNIPFADLAIQLGADRLRAQAEKFGFDHDFEIPLAVQASTYPAGSLDPAQVGLTGFGQFDVRATPMQMALVSAAIANGGKLMNPELVEQVLSPDLTQLQGPKTSEFGTVMSASTADALRSMMIDSVSKGVASNARIDGIDVAGKTGTAENGQGEAYSLWFTGFAASGSHDIAVAVVLEDGGGMGQSGTGNGLAATIGHDVMKAVLDQ